mmetsp:Transcript_39304/g.100727  ORF Transcript_39304/g.100727 Transcript_39304/m.100727 type:complete len:236 (+) Transcript_39304:937-1644(+)
MSLVCRDFEETCRLATNLLVSWMSLVTSRRTNLLFTICSTSSLCPKAEFHLAWWDEAAASRCLIFSCDKQKAADVSTESCTSPSPSLPQSSLSASAFLSACSSLSHVPFSWFHTKDSHTNVSALSRISFSPTRTTEAPVAPPIGRINPGPEFARLRFIDSSSSSSSQSSGSLTSAGAFAFPTVGAMLSSSKKSSISSSFSSLLLIGSGDKTVFFTREPSISSSDPKSLDPSYSSS